jgi:hypothetical protein
MRLLCFQDSELSLVEFPDDKIPLYAILSHTWGPDGEEVTFTDLVDGTGREKPGYEKILSCGKQAAKDDLGYWWVDTCCINKSSSAELSEAINSMFRWYQDASVCYAYVADIPDDGAATHGAVKDFAACRWFTRGWTLQELLAPKKMRFFSKSWLELGSRNELAQAISMVTNIDFEYLSDTSSLRRDLHEASIAKRMSWASSRITTRVEDLAYCLLGLFDVNMPLLYGEGQKAFIRLQEEIMRVSDDQSLFAWGLDLKETSAESLDAPQGLFASSAAEFSNSGRIIPDEGAACEEPYALTNKGVRVNLPTFKEDPYTNSFMAIIACRPEDTLQHVLAMPLVAAGGSQFTRCSMMPVVIPRDSVTAPVNKTLYIQRTLPKQSKSCSMSSHPNVFWIRNFPSSSGVRISTVQPTAYWNSRDRLVREITDDRRHNWKARMTVAMEYGNQEQRTILLGRNRYGYLFAHLLLGPNELSESSPLSRLKVGLATQCIYLQSGYNAWVVDVTLADIDETVAIRGAPGTRLFT